jgi:hypothetical protein
MLKNTILKGLTTINSQLLGNTPFRNYFQKTSNKSIFYNNTTIKNTYIYSTAKRFFSTEEAQTNTDKTDLVLKEKNKNKKTFKTKTEDAKKSEKAEAKSESAEKPTAESNENSEGKETKAETENLKSANDKDFSQTKEDKKFIRKVNFKNYIKEAVNLKDMYQIQSSKMGAVNPRKFFDFSKFKYPNVSVKVFDRVTFTADEKLDGKSLTPVSPKLGPFVVCFFNKLLF